MRKITLLVLILGMSGMVFGQSRTGISDDLVPYNGKIQIHTLDAKALNDTLMYFNGRDFWVNPTDDANFDAQTEDLDLYATTNGGNWDSEWPFWFTDNMNSYDFRPWDVDSAFMTGVTSWFQTPATSDDWFEFGPITIPTTGAAITWDVKSNPGYTDGYRLLVSTTGMDNYIDFTGGPIFARADMYPAPDSDTAWADIEVAVPSAYAGMQIYFGFHHNANDMDVLWFDEVVILEKNNIGLAEGDINGVSMTQNYPNPASDVTMIAYEISQASNVSLEIHDISGRLVRSLEMGAQNAGLYNYNVDLSGLNSGAYIYTLVAGNTRVSKQMMVR